MTQTIEQIRRHLEGLKAMKELKAEDFAEEDGLAASLALSVKDKLKPTQLRKVFHQIKDIRRVVDREKTFDRAKVAMVMPLLAYGVGRGLVPKDFYETMKLCFGKERCATMDDFTRASDFLEAVMAYHKYYTETQKGKPEEA